MKMAKKVNTIEATKLNIESKILEIKEIAKAIESAEEALEKQLEHGLIDSDEVQRQKQAMTKKFLESVKNIHNHPITQGKGKDKRFVTYFDLPEGGRKPVRKQTEKEVLIELSKLYGISEDAPCTLTTLYEKWIVLYYKNHLGATESTHTLITNWEKFIKDHPIAKKDITKIKTSELNAWALECISKYNLTSKAFAKPSQVMKELFDCAVMDEIVPINRYRQIRFHKGTFAQPKQKSDALECFSETEQLAVCEEAYKDYLKTGEAVPLGIILCFYTGCRSGELVALKSTDVNGNKLEIRRQEIRQGELNLQTLKMENTHYIVVEHTKAYNNRDITLVDSAKTVIELIKKTNALNGYKEDNFLFVDEKGRVHERAFDTRLRKYCRHLGIPERSLNKERKTFISTIANSPFTSIKDAQREAGHKYLSTTMDNYYKDTKHDEEKLVNMEKALAHLPVVSA